MNTICPRVVFVYFVLLLDCALGQRALHWVIRVSDLEATLNFTQHVLGMQVLRHEENDKPCPITCNGNFDTRWSKTMVGYTTEDKGYALELTFNYGVATYDKSNGLQRFSIRMDHISEKAKMAIAMGYTATNYEDESTIVIGPDGYEFELLHSPASQKQGNRFNSIQLSAERHLDLAEWYVSVLGMKKFSVESSGSESALVGYDKSLVFNIVRSKDPVKITQWDGRNAVAIPERQIRALNEKLAKTSEHLIVHSMREFHEKLGTLVILIVKDPIVGYEVCVVSSETFDPSVIAATDFNYPDWKQREAFLSALSTRSHSGL